MSNSLAKVHPERIPEWSEKNNPLTPEKITYTVLHQVLNFKLQSFFFISCL